MFRGMHQQSLPDSLGKITSTPSLLKDPVTKLILAYTQKPNNVWS